MPSEGQGEGTAPGEQLSVLSDPHHSRADAKLIRRAIREGWPIPRSARKSIVASLVELATKEDAQDMTRVRAAATLIAADQVNARREANEIRQEQPAPAGTAVQVNVNVQQQHGLSPSALKAYAAAMEAAGLADKSKDAGQSSGVD